MYARISTYKLPRKIVALPPLMLLIGALLIAMTWYVSATSAYVSMQYVISDHSSLRASLIVEIENLETRIANETRPEVLEERASELGFITIQKPRYMSVPGKAVARR